MIEDIQTTKEMIKIHKDLTDQLEEQQEEVAMMEERKFRRKLLRIQREQE